MTWVQWGQHGNDGDNGDNVGTTEVWGPHTVVRTETTTMAGVWGQHGDLLEMMGMMWGYRGHMGMTGTMWGPWDHVGTMKSQKMQ